MHPQYPKALALQQVKDDEIAMRKKAHPALLATKVELDHKCFEHERELIRTAASLDSAFAASRYPRALWPLVLACMPLTMFARVRMNLARYLGLIGPKHSIAHEKYYAHCGVAALRLPPAAIPALAKERYVTGLNLASAEIMPPMRRVRSLQDLPTKTRIITDARSVLGINEKTPACSGRLRIAILDDGINQAFDVMRSAYVVETRSFIENGGPGPCVHGTYVAAFAAGLGCGTAEGASLLSAVIFPAEGEPATLGAIVQALDWASPRSDVINCSFGSPETGGVLDHACSRLSEQNVVVAAAGNRASDGVCSPANADGVIGVGALGLDDNGALVAAPWSARATSEQLKREKPACSAPGAHLRSELNHGCPDVVSGTSFASPLVAGLASRAIQYLDSFRAPLVALRSIARQTRGVSLAQQARSLLLGSCAPLDGQLRSQAGRGVPNFSRFPKT